MVVKKDMLKQILLYHSVSNPGKTSIRAVHQVVIFSTSEEHD